MARSSGSTLPTISYLQRCQTCVERTALGGQRWRGVPGLGLGVGLGVARGDRRSLGACRRSRLQVSLPLQKPFTHRRIRQLRGVLEHLGSLLDQVAQGIVLERIEVCKVREGDIAPEQVLVHVATEVQR